MNASGVIDFQSHTMHHHSIFTDGELAGFVNPQLSTSFLSGSLNPVIRMNGTDVVTDKPPLGHPIYNWAPAMSAKQRYIENENVSRAVIDFVKRNGNSSFFLNKRWRSELDNFYRSSKKRFVKQDRWQTDKERYTGIFNDLLQSRLTIEERLNKKVKHLCYPWNIGSPTAVGASQQAGYSSNYWGLVNDKAINRSGDDPYYVKRLSANFISTLPGKGRSSLVKIYLNRQLKNRLQQLFW